MDHPSVPFTLGESLDAAKCRFHWKGQVQIAPARIVDGMPGLLRCCLPRFMVTFVSSMIYVHNCLLSLFGIHVQDVGFIDGHALGARGDFYVLSRGEHELPQSRDKSLTRAKVVGSNLWYLRIA
jgi:hypothetical protein